MTYPTWSTACPDWRKRIVAGQSLLTSPPLFDSQAKAALEKFDALKLVDVAGAPTFGEIARPWVRDFVAAIFGANDPETGEQLINEFFLLISKKNGKSTLAAGIMVTALLMNWREDAELIILAPTKEVADNSAKPALAMVRKDPELAKMLKPVPHERKIEHRVTGATLKIVAADAETVGGKKASFVLIDELWLFGKRPNAEDMLREATGGLASRPEGFVIALSTQSNEPPAGVFKDWLDRFRKIREGELEAPESLGLLYEFPEEMVKSGAYKDPANYYVTNPNFGASVSERFLKLGKDKADQKGPKSLVGYYAKHLNVEPGMGARSDTWAGAEFWKRRADPSLTLDALIERCEVICVGLDGGGMDDLYGMSIVGREAKEIEIDAAALAEPEEGLEATLGKVKVKAWLSCSHAWAHQIVLQRRKSIASKLEDLERAGELTLLADDALDEKTGWPADIAQIVAVIKRIKDAGLLCCVAVDPAGLGELIEALALIDVTPENKASGFNYVVGVQQGIALMNALKTCERKLANGTLTHADQALMDWCVANLKIEPTTTAIRATKANAGDAKIDPAMALFNAATALATNPPSPRSVYEHRDLLVL